MKQRGKIQIGTTFLDAEIEMEAIEVPEEAKADIDRMRQFFSTHRNQINEYLKASFEKVHGAEYGKSPVETAQEYMDKYPTWTTTVEGSIVEPITDEGRLLS